MGAIVTRAEVEPLLKPQGGSLRADNESFVDACILAAEGTVQRISKRKLVPEPALVSGVDSAPPVAKTFQVRKPGTIRVPDLRTVSSFSLGGLALVEGTGYALSARRIPYDEPATHIEIFSDVYLFNTTSTALVITGKWGFHPCPEEVKNVIKVLVARMFKERDANYADTVQPGIESAAFSYFKQLPASSQAVVTDLRPTEFAMI